MHTHTHTSQDTLNNDDNKVSDVSSSVSSVCVSVGDVPLKIKYQIVQYLKQNKGFYLNLHQFGYVCLCVYVCICVCTFVCIT